MFERWALNNGATCSVGLLYFTVGRRSDDPLSPAYVPSIFSFTTPRGKRELEQGLERYQAAKQRRDGTKRTSRLAILCKTFS